MYFSALLLWLNTLLVLLTFTNAAENFGCLNEKGEFVDWWIIYKEPKGLRYVYTDSQRKGVPQNLSKKRLITHKNGPLLRTIRSSGFLSPNNSNRSPFYLAWNDQMKEFSKAKLAHAKGFMGIKNSSKGIVESFFIQHTLPRFPLHRSRKLGMFDTNIDSRAQHFVCISMLDEFEQETNTSPIFISSVRSCNFFKILWNYVRTIDAGFLSYQSTLNHSMGPFNPILQHIINIPSYGLVKDDTVYAVDPLTSFSIQSTGTEDDKLHFQIFAKTADNEIDIYDDVTALLSIHHEDYFEGNIPKVGHTRNMSAMLMVAQSHTDSATLGANQKTLIDREGLFATVHILNSSSVELPDEDGEHSKKVHSLYRDHSKWSVNTIYGLEGEFPSLLCFYDLNRSTKQVTRGGGAFCLNSTLTKTTQASRALWDLFMSFRPTPTNMARFNNADISETLSKILTSRDAINVVDLGTPILDKEISEYVTRSKRRRSNSSVSNSPFNQYTYFSPRLSVSKFTDNSLEIKHPENGATSLVPCPYKFSKSDDLSGKYRGIRSVPSEYVCKISSLIQNYGLSNFNKALSPHGYYVDKLQKTSSVTPIRSNVSSFTPGTIRVPAQRNDLPNISGTKRSSLSSEQTDEDTSDEFTSRFLGGYV